MKNEYRIDYAEYDSEEVVKGSKALDSVFDYGSTVDVTAYLNWRVQGKPIRNSLSFWEGRF